MRDRLAEIYHNIEIEYLDYLTNIAQRAIDGDIEDEIQQRQQFYVDKLLENGVIVPPCKVGDVVYEALPSVGHIRSNKVVGFHLGKFPDTQGHKRKEYLVCYSDYSLTHIAIDKFGKTVFLTKEEAEQALKGGAE